MKTEAIVGIVFGVIAAVAIVWGVWYENFAGKPSKEGDSISQETPDDESLKEDGDDSFDNDIE